MDIKHQLANQLRYFLCIILFVNLIYSQSEQPYPPLDLVTIPTGGTLPKGSYTLEALLMNDGGILSKISVGISDNFCMGLSYGLQDFISEKEPSINKSMPEIQIKYRIYEESEAMPAIALGMNTQGKGRYVDKIGFEINLQKVSNDKYLKINKIKSPLINNFSTLHSFLNLTKSNEDYSLEASFEVYEDLSKNRSDRFEYVYPNFVYNKDLDSLNENLKFTSTGFQKKYNTNIYEASIINDIKYLSKPIFSANGLKNNYTILFRNVNTNSENSSTFKKDNDHKLLSAILFETKYPLKKSDDKYMNYLTPILSARYSPNKTKNIKNLDRRLEYNNIFSLDRIGENDMVEGGLSLSLGLEYSKKDIENNDLFNLGLATVLRNKEDKDLPTKSTLGQKTSDIVGNLKFIPSKFFDFEYEFSLDNNLNETNYNLAKTNLSINNFVTSFEFLQEDNMIGDKSYLSNKTTFSFDESNFLSFKTNRNLDKDISEYYTLIYEYKNDCLTAAIEYDKQYYTDSDLKPEKNIFFSIKIIPFGKINTPSIN